MTAPDDSAIRDYVRKHWRDPWKGGGPGKGCVGDAAIILFSTTTSFEGKARILEELSRLIGLEADDADDLLRLQRLRLDPDAHGLVAKGRVPAVPRMLESRERGGDVQEGEEMTGFIINPGSGPLTREPGQITRRNADRNMRALLSDSGLTGSRWGRHGKLAGDGRYGYRVEVAGRWVDIDMPGLPLERVRYRGKRTGCPLSFPRLYVDGNSWLWCYAVSILDDIKTGKDV